MTDSSDAPKFHADRRTLASFFAAIFLVTLALRMCHVRVLWADEDYHLAAALQLLRGKMLYRDLWYDKPPLSALLYAAMGALRGWPLRVFDALYTLAACAALFRFTRDVWGDREAMLATLLFAFYLNFALPSAVIPIAPDYFLLVPQILAVHCAWKGRAIAAGVWSGVAFLFQAKGIFTLAMCAVLAGRSLPMLLLGFAIPNGLALAWLAFVGALPEYWQQVWIWGSAYARSSPDPHPWSNALRRVADWLGFHAALVIGVAALWWHNRRRENYWMAAWLALAFVTAALGIRFFPRYLLALLPPMALMAAAGLFRHKGAAIAAIAALFIPLGRFAPRYGQLASDLMAARPHQWSDIALDADSRAVSASLNALKHPGDTLFVWGYRPGIFVFTHLPPASRFWDSQPLTGVPADRHLRDTSAVLPEAAAENRAVFAESEPTFVVDSLSPSNPRLSIDAYPELRPWLASYNVVARTGASIIYRRR